MKGVADNFQESRVASFLNYTKKGLSNVSFSTISSALKLLDISSSIWQSVIVFSIVTSFLIFLYLFRYFSDLHLGCQPADPILI